MSWHNAHVAGSSAACDVAVRAAAIEDWRRGRLISQPIPQLCPVSLTRPFASNPKRLLLQPPFNLLPLFLDIQPPPDPPKKNHRPSRTHSKNCQFFFLVDFFCAQRTKRNLKPHPTARTVIMPEDAPYDPYIPSGQAAPAGGQGNARTQALQAVSSSLIPGALVDGFGPGLRSFSMGRPSPSSHPALPK